MLQKPRCSFTELLKALSLLGLLSTFVSVLPVHVAPEVSLDFRTVVSPFLYSYLLCPVSTLVGYLANFTLVLAGLERVRSYGDKFSSSRLRVRTVYPALLAAACLLTIPAFFKYRPLLHPPVRVIKAPIKSITVANWHFSIPDFAKLAFFKSIWH